MSKSNVVQLVTEGKVCAGCKEFKPFTEYHKQNCTPDKLRYECKSCRNIAYRNARGNDADKRKNVVLIENGRVCIECNEGKTWNKFSRDKWGYEGKQAQCKDCKRKTRKPDLREHNYKARPAMVQWKYGVTYAHVIQTLADQHGRCANKACGKEIFLDIPKGPTQAQIDHDHKTGKFRGVMCVGCNTLLGRLEDRQHIVDGLMDYAAKHRTKESLK